MIEYIDCQVHAPAAFVAANETFDEAMSGGLRPTVSITVILWNGSSPATHTVLVNRESYQSGGCVRPDRTESGRIELCQNRAGLEDATHFVVFLAPSLTSLNEFLDGVTASDAYADFVDEVLSIRTLQTASQARNVAVWTP